ncbi:hypothetical protein LEN26_008360 [Aphanomyces euteiches]|nr:hypothetical protein AeMF1_014911 [Aphanomyces euteiches]KAH9130619.1 hypothetical protein LEN26_008360 [Aphanomyces euteiches]KAH9187978.1 hypothetical protein AeNC1_010047 [Aphanomyces euteiches]
MAYDHASPGVQDGNSIVAYRETDWVPRPTDLKDTEEYEQNFQMRRRNRILMIVAATFVVVGAAIGVIVATSSKGSAISTSSADITQAPTTTAAPVLSDTVSADVPSTSDPTTQTPQITYSVADVNSTSGDATNSTAKNGTSAGEVSVGSTGSSTESLSISETTTSAPTTVAPTPAPTPEPTTAAPTPAPTPPPTTTTPKPTPAPTPPPTTTGPLAPGYFRFVNNCQSSYSLWYSSLGGAKQVVKVLGPGDTFDTDGRLARSAMFFVSSSSNSLGDATLFETEFSSGTFYYDISIIPVGCGVSWDSCGGKHYAFNVPMSVIPSKTGGTCKNLVCGAPGCSDAYHVPNDPQTWTCPGSVSMVISFC